VTDEGSPRGFRGMDGDAGYDLQTRVERQRTWTSRFELVIFLADGTARPNIALNISPVFSLVRSCL